VRLSLSRTTTAPRIATKSLIDEIEKQRGRGATLNLAATTNKTMHDVSFARPSDTGRKDFPWRSVSNRAQPRLGLLPVDDEA
jgi:hypothetical protein